MEQFALESDCCHTEQDGINGFENALPDANRSQIPIVLWMLNDVNVFRSLTIVKTQQHSG
jgi:hypothetical protein